MKTLIFFNTLFGFLTIFAMLCSLSLGYLIITRYEGRLSQQIRDHVLHLACSVAITSILGSLIYSEVIGFIPCEFCWYQRYFMYPLGIFSLYVTVTKSYVRLGVLIAGLGSLVSIRHIYLQNGGGPTGACSVEVPCSIKYVDIFNFISIPIMALTAFITISLSMLYYELSNKVENE